MLGHRRPIFCLLQNCLTKWQILPFNGSVKITTWNFGVMILSHGVKTSELCHHLLFFADNSTFCRICSTSLIRWFPSELCILSKVVPNSRVVLIASATGCVANQAPALSLAQPHRLGKNDLLRTSNLSTPFINLNPTFNSCILSRRFGRLVFFYDSCKRSVSCHLSFASLTHSWYFITSLCEKIQTSVVGRNPRLLPEAISLQRFSALSLVLILASTSGLSFQKTFTKPLCSLEAVLSSSYVIPLLHVCFRHAYSL